MAQKGPFKVIVPAAMASTGAMANDSESCHRAIVPSCPLKAIVPCKGLLNRVAVLFFLAISIVVPCVTFPFLIPKLAQGPGKRVLVIGSWLFLNMVLDRASESSFFVRGCT